MHCKPFRHVHFDAKWLLLVCHNWCMTYLSDLDFGYYRCLLLNSVELAAVSKREAKKKHELEFDSFFRILNVCAVCVPLNQHYWTMLAHPVYRCVPFSYCCWAIFRHLRSPLPPYLDMIVSYGQKMFCLHHRSVCCARPKGENEISN